MEVLMINNQIFRKVIIARQMGRVLNKNIKISHALWVCIFKKPSVIWKKAPKLQKQRNPKKNSKMGGDLRREEHDNISRWQEMPKVWTKLEKGFMTHFMEKLVDYDKSRVNLAVTKVTENWKDGSFKIHGVRFKLDVDFISMITGMPHSSLNFFRDLKVSNNAVKLFRVKRRRD